MIGFKRKIFFDCYLHKAIKCFQIIEIDSTKVKNNNELIEWTNAVVFEKLINVSIIKIFFRYSVPDMSNIFLEINK
jgi:hypothetical protein